MTPKHYTPHDYTQFLPKEKDLENNRLIVVGGQAINLWATYYYEKLTIPGPYASRDLDLFGTIELLRKVAKFSNSKFKQYPIRPPGPAVGIIEISALNSDVLIIEILKSIKGLSSEEVNKNSFYPFQIAEEKTVYTLSPILLLKTKIQNIHEIPQTERNDIQHVKILFEIIPWYFIDLLDQVTNRQLQERSLITQMELLLAIITSSISKTVLSELKLNPLSLYEPFKRSSLPKTQAFMAKRITRIQTSH